jgi:hypothetical protein
VADLRTTVTELGTALGMLGYDSVDDAICARPPVMVSVSPEQWQRLTAARQGGAHEAEFHAAFTNGRAFLEARFGLRGRLPEMIEWKGSQKAPGDEVVPADLRIDHVYLVSCKYLSKILLNTSPGQLFDHLLVGPGGQRRPDWFSEVAAREYDDLYQQVRQAWRRGDLPVTRSPSEAELTTSAQSARNGLSGDALPGFVGTDTEGSTMGLSSLTSPSLVPLPADLGELVAAERAELSRLLAPGWPPEAVGPYQALNRAVAQASADRWLQALKASSGAKESMLWRLLRMHSAPYFVLGTSKKESLRLRVATPWDWRQKYRLVNFAVAPLSGGQALVGWQAVIEDRHNATRTTVDGHIEVRWSHGRFKAPPEAKVYLDTPHSFVPGYETLL